ncbi:MAG: hypothetical protein WDM89_20445 [Rhizomicrobium sp.]
MFKSKISHFLASWVFRRHTLSATATVRVLRVWRRKWPKKVQIRWSGENTHTRVLQRVAVLVSWRPSDFGKTLGDPVTISNSKYASGKLRLAASESNLYAIWAQHEDGGFALMFTRSINHGYAGSWSSPANLGLFKISLMQIAADGANVHIAYLRTDGAVAVLNSSDGGQHFSQPVNIAPGWGEVVLSSLGKNVFLSWKYAF